MNKRQAKKKRKIMKAFDDTFYSCTTLTSLRKLKHDFKEYEAYAKRMNAIYGSKANYDDLW